MLAIGLFYTVYYCIVGIYAIQEGYLNYEHLFVADKLQLLFTTDIKTLELFYFTYPVLEQVMAIPAGFVDPVLAPVITSSIVMGGFAAYIVVKLFKLGLKFFSCMATAYFLCSPIMVFLAISGTSLYLYLLLYFLFFHYVFKYARDLTTYNFVIISICLSAFVFLDYSFLWIIVFMVPLVFLFSIYSDPLLKPNFVAIFNQITQRSDKIKQLVGRFLSSYLVIVFTPLISLLFYLLINYWFTGEAFYFDKTFTSRWHQYGLLNYTFEGSLIKDSFTVGYVLRSILFLCPFFVTALWLGRRRLLFQYTMVMVPLWLIFSKNYDGTQFFSLHILLIITASGIAGIIHLFQTSLLQIFKAKWTMPLVILLVFGFTLTGEFYYFRSTHSAVEKKMVNLVLQQKLDDEMNAFMDMAGYIKENTRQDEAILADNAIFYPTMAVTRDDVQYVDQFTDVYYSALQSPMLYAHYLLVSNPNSIYQDRDQMRAVFLQKSASLKILYTNDFFSLYKLDNPPSSKLTYARRK
ncbi:MAG: hypothetical protein CL868_15595 [Cytophagaceae bacterium]|nr:hypothetical protein [Cytophagaceae bacterium]|tara:strand:- start:8644 stop:10203 length:1560 start_codon:yes stop_codon:yes gene_type:complete